MATLRQDLGPVTAYAFAVEKGYTGTEEEYAELMASYATVAEAAAGSASDAADSASDAEAYGAGTRGGSAVESGDEAYHNNAKYYAESAADDASTVASAVNSFMNITVPAAVQSVTDEGTTQIGLVQGEGTTQVGLVQAKGTEQVAAVQAKGTEVIGSIPEDYTELSDDVGDLKSALEDITQAKDKTTEITDFALGYFNNMYLYIGSGGYLAIFEMQNGAKYTIETSGTYNRFAIGAGNSKTNQSQMSFRETGTSSASGNKYIYTNTSNYKYLFVWLNYGTSDFDCVCTIREVVGDINNLALNGVPIYNKTQVDTFLKEKRNAAIYGTVNNILDNGDFHTASSPLQYVNCTGAVSDGVLTVTGNGGGDTIKTSYYYEISDVKANKYYVALWVRANSNNCQSIILRIAGGLGQTVLVKPVSGKWYLLTGKYNSTLTGDTTSAYSLWGTYADATTENGESISIKQATAFYVNTDFGIGIDPALYKLNNIIKNNEYWIGSRKVMVDRFPDPIVEPFIQRQSFGKKRRPLVTFVDDDGWQRVYDELSPISEKYNVPFVSAIQIGSTINDWNALYLQDELAWELAVHPDCGEEGGLATLETEEEINQWFEDTNAYLDSHGYKWKNVVYAAGEPDERVRRLAKQYYRCGAVGSSPKVNRGIIANFEIQRIPIGYPMGAEWNTFANLKSYIDDAIEHNGWCIFMTHAGMTNHHTAEITQIIDQLVDYCVNTVEVDIVTLNDGFNVFGNAVETGDYVGENARVGDDKTKGIAISQDGLIGNVISKASMDNLLETIGSAIGGTFTTICDRDTGAYTYTFTSN